MNCIETTRQQGIKVRERMFGAIKDYIRQHGYPPTVREICDMTGMTSTSTVHYHMQQMFADGTLETDHPGMQGRNIFVCSMADLFGDWVPDNWIKEVFKACEKAPQHNYLFLTKNVKRYVKYRVPMLENMWYGTSITREADMHLFNFLPEGCNTFVSIEPILSDLEVEKHNIMFRLVDWFIIGAETGNRKSKVIPERKWIEDIVNECKKRNKPVFMKSSLADIWGEPLIQEFPKELRR